jgi:hypothetical protein
MLRPPHHLQQLKDNATQALPPREAIAAVVLFIPSTLRPHNSKRCHAAPWCLLSARPGQDAARRAHLAHVGAGRGLASVGCGPHCPMSVRHCGRATVGRMRVVRACRARFWPSSCLKFEISFLFFIRF